jgi:hypothetical protein
MPFWEAANCAEVESLFDDVDAKKRRYNGVKKQGQTQALHRHERITFPIAHLLIQLGLK